MVGATSAISSATMSVMSGLASSPQARRKTTTYRGPGPELTATTWPRLTRPGSKGIWKTSPIRAFGRLTTDPPKLLSELLSNRLPTAATTTKEARDELENGWARVASIHRPADYESAALTN